MKNLREGSESLTDLLYEFTLWLFRMSVPVVCFFELDETGYGKRFGIMGEMAGNMIKGLVVNETSACIDGHQRLSLPTDHLEINKYYGPDDPSFKKVYPEIQKMAQNADKVVQQRLNPREIVQDDFGIPQKHMKCLQSLFLTNPLDDLAAIRRSKGERVKGTCEWLLVQEKYTAWLVEDGAQLLRLVGNPGIGKTMISAYLVDELEERARISPAMTFTYYFCDNKDEKRNTATAIVRGLLLQLLRQHHNFFRYIQPEFDLMKDELFNHFDALWRILCKILGDFKEDEVYVLIDALDECEKSTRGALLSGLRKLFTPSRTAGTANIKFLITGRPEIDDELPNIGRYLRIDSTKVNADLSAFIRDRVGYLSRKKMYSDCLEKAVQDALITKAEGTFLWASLVLKDLDKEDDKTKVRQMLQELPRDLNEVYDRILSQIDPKHEDTAKFVLRCVAVARRPLTVDELVMAYAMSPGKWERNIIPDKRSLDDWNNIYKFCEPFVYIDNQSKTINLVHQSAKDYLLNSSRPRPLSLIILRLFTISAILWASLYGVQITWVSLLAIAFLTIFILAAMPSEVFSYPPYPFLIAVRNLLGTLSDFLYTITGLSGYTIFPGKVILVFKSFWKYFLATTTGLSRYSVLPGKANLLVFEICWRYLSMDEFDQGRMIIKLDKRNRLYRAVLPKEYLGSHDFLQYARQEWQEHALAAISALVTDYEFKKDNLDKVPTLRDTWLFRAAAEGQEVVVRLLLEKGADVESKSSSGRTPLSWAAGNGHEAVVKLLLEKGADIESTDTEYGQTPLSWAAENGHEAIVKLLLEKGADVESKSSSGRTPLSRAAENGREAVVKLLLEKGADVESKDTEYGRTPLLWAAENGHEAIVKLLLEMGADMESKSSSGRTPLLWAAGNGREAVVKLLLEKGADVESKSSSGQTPLSWAAENGHEAVVKLLLERGAQKLIH